MKALNKTHKISLNQRTIYNTPFLFLYTAFQDQKEWRHARTIFIRIINAASIAPTILRPLSMKKYTSKEQSKL